MPRESDSEEQIVQILQKAAGGAERASPRYCGAGVRAKTYLAGGLRFVGAGKSAMRDGSGSWRREPAAEGIGRPANLDNQVLKELLAKIDVDCDPAGEVVRTAKDARLSERRASAIVRVRRSSYRHRPRGATRCRYELDCRSLARVSGRITDDWLVLLRREGYHVKSRG